MGMERQVTLQLRMELMGFGRSLTCRDRNIMEYHGVSRSILEYLGVSWSILEYLGASWYVCL